MCPFFAIASLPWEESANLSASIFNELVETSSPFLLPIAPQIDANV
jgi:hypothetical protein